MSELSLSEILAVAEAYDKRLPEMPKIQPINSRPLAAWMDQTLLKPEASREQVENLCQEARVYHFAAVCINGIYLPWVSSILKDSDVKVCTVMGFPLGAVPTEIKVAEAKTYMRLGAVELDMVIPVGRMKGREYQAVYDDIRAVVEAAHSGGAIVKVILEMCLLDRYEKIMGCLLSKAAGAEFVKTSTGFSTHGATLDDVELMRRVVGPELGVKAAGGIRSLPDAQAMLQAGADRLGTSAGVKILQEAQVA
jgi:deoxyribose-phosphate aldolase